MSVKKIKSFKDTLISKADRFIFLLIIFFIPTQLGKHFWPSFTTVSGLRIDYLSPTLFVTDLLIVILIGMQIFKISLNIKKVNFRKWIIQGLNQKTTRLLLIFLPITILGVVYSERPLLGLYGLCRFLELIVFAWFTKKTLLDKTFRHTTILVFAFSMITQSVLAIAQFLNQGSLNGALYYLGERTFTSETPGIANASLGNELYLRPYATFPHPNVLAGYLLIGIVLLQTELTQKLTRVKRRFLLLVSALSFITILFTMSRIVIILAVLILFFIFVKSKQFKNIKEIKKKYLYILGFIFLFLLSVFNSPILLRFSSLNLKDEAVAQRQKLSVSAINMIKDHPLLGVGLNHFLIKLPPYKESYDTPMQPVHNIYLLTAAETGIIGLIIFFNFLFINIKRIIKNNIKNYFPPIILISIILIIGMFDHYFLTIQQGRLIFALVLGITYIDNYK